MVLEANQLEAAAPGIRRLELSRKPASELRPSVQKLVQGMLEFSLETPRTAAAAAAAADDDVAPSATVTANTSTPLAYKTHGRNRLCDGVRGGTVNAGSPPGGHSAAATKFWHKNKEANIHPEKDHEVEQASRVIEEDIVEHETGEWEGVVWDEDDMSEVDSLGTVSASLGIVEAASKHRKTSRADPTVPEPQDLLICVKGAVGIREVIIYLYDRR